MRMILPEAGDELDDFELAEAYACPRERWLRTNMVMSADGAGSLNGLSGGLSAAGDKRVFGILRVLADGVLVGSGTAEARSYKPPPRPSRRCGPGGPRPRRSRPSAAPSTWAWPVRCSPTRRRTRGPSSSPAR